MNVRPYRGKRKDNGKWVYGWYCEIAETHFIIPKSAMRTIYKAITPSSDRLDFTGFVQVDPVTVGQQVDLKDKHGKGREIYEGDLYQGKESGIVLLVEFQEGEYILTKNVDYSPHRIAHCDLYYALHNLAIEFIGNVHTEQEK